MEFHQLISERQSERSYLPTKVEEEKILQCIAAAQLAPSACNAQPWKFILIDEPSLKEEVAKHTASMGMNKFAFEAPLIIAIVLEKPNLTSKIGSVLKGKEFTLIDIGIAATHLCLQATELGLGSCIIGWFDEKKIRKALSIPSSKRIPLLITLGYTQNEKRKKNRKELSQIFSRNTY